MGKLQYLYNFEVLASLFLAFLHKGKSVFSQDDVQEALEARSSGNVHYCAVFSARMGIASGQLNYIFSLIQTKDRHRFLIKSSKVPVTKLWFVDQGNQGNKSCDEQLENVSQTWGMSTRSPCPVLGTAHTTVLLPCTPGLQDGAGLFGVTTKRTEMSRSSTHPCPQRGRGSTAAVFFVRRRWP